MCKQPSLNNNSTVFAYTVKSDLTTNSEQQPPAYDGQQDLHLFNIDSIFYEPTNSNQFLNNHHFFDSQE